MKRNDYVRDFENRKIDAIINLLSSAKNCDEKAERKNLIYRAQKYCEVEVQMMNLEPIELSKEDFNKILHIHDLPTQ